MSETYPDGVHKLPEQVCLNCGHHFNACGVVGEENAPQPKVGDTVVCIQCAGVMQIGPDLRLKGFTEEEARAVAADGGLVDQLMRTVGRVRIVKARMN
jgi:hypothetical protein